MVWDKRDKTYRPVQYRDMVILMRATANMANLVMDVFSRLGIPAYAQLNTGYFEAVEVETVLSLLRIIDNPRQDIPLAAVLRSPIVGLDENGLALARLADKSGDFYDAVVAASAQEPLTPVLVSFLARLEEWRTAARQGPLSELIWRLYRETGYYAYAGGLPGGSQRQANLRSLHDRARLFDQFTRQGLARFLRFIDRLRETEGDLGPPPPLGEGENAVRIMSIHRSKGLEFPVVFLAGLGKRFNLTDTTGDLVCHRDLGFGPMVVDAARRLKYPSLAKRAVAARVRSEAVAEEMRILYVGMTRARDRLILVGSRRDLEAELAGWCLAARPEEHGKADRPPRLSPAMVARALSYLDWLGPAVACHPHASVIRLTSGCEVGTTVADPSKWEVRLWGLEGFPPIPLEAGLHKKEGGGMPALDWGRLDRLEPLENVPSGPVSAALDWHYPNRRLSSLAAKVTATELKRLRESAHAEEAAGTGPAGAAPPGLRFSTLTAVRPRFLQSAPGGLTPVERGRATHLVLQHLGLSDPAVVPAGAASLPGPIDRESLARLAASLAEREFMTPEQAEAVDVEALARFFESDLGRWLVEMAPNVRREVPFTLALPADEVHGRDWREEESDHAASIASESRLCVAGSGETVLAQGIIDVLVVEPDGLTILDFKTDRATAEEAPARAEDYEPQLRLYRRAVETIWNRPVKAAWLCFLTPGVNLESGDYAPPVDK
jgi:ATP-dependent helicase/nuclease subunit A